jgi:hypothetical protein
VGNQLLDQTPLSSRPGVAASTMRSVELAYGLNDFLDLSGKLSTASQDNSLRVGRLLEVDA